MKKKMKDVPFFLWMLAVIFIFLASVAGAEKQYVALTFDDGPHPFYTEKIIGILRSYDVHAAFFLVGKQAKQYPYLVKAIRDAGNEIGNHTYNHPRLIYLGDEEVKKEIETNNELLKSITGQEVKYFRPPGGRYYFSTLKVLRDMEIILWTINTDDIYKSADRIYEDSVEAVDGDIILLHSGVPQTIEALPRILKYFSSHNIKPVLISELKDIRSRESFNRRCPQGL